MKNFSTLALASLLLAGNTTLTLAADAAPHQMAMTSAAAGPADSMTQGEVRKVDKAAMKITLKHAEIKNLDMPPMTMVFRVKDPAVLDKVKAGDKVVFTAEEIKGALTVITLAPAKN